MLLFIDKLSSTEAFCNPEVDTVGDSCTGRLLDMKDVAVTDSLGLYGVL